MPRRVGVPGGSWPTMGVVSQAPAPRVPRRPRYQPYRTVAVVAVALGLAAVPLLAIVGHRQLAVLWLVVGLLTRSEGVV